MAAIPTPEPRLRRVLSVQSSCVRSVVGNRASAFPLMLAGFEVDVLNTVQLAHHTGYGAAFPPRGKGLGGDDVEALLAGLRAAGLLRGYSAVLTGYTSQAGALRAIAKAVREMRAMRVADGGGGGGLDYVCDPVLGDNGRFYVPADLLPVYRDELCPLATLLTPNQFEAEQLSGVTIAGRASAEAALDALHALGARCVVVTSTDARLLLKGEACGEGEGKGAESSYLLLIASCPREDVRNSRALGGCSDAGGDCGLVRFAVRVPRIAWSFTGTGDLAAALLIIERDRNPGDLVAAVEGVAAALHSVCLRTHAHYLACEAAARSGSGDADAVAALRDAAATVAAAAPGTQVAAFNELQVVASREDFEQPPRGRYPGMLAEPLANVLA